MNAIVEYLDIRSVTQLNGDIPGTKKWGYASSKAKGSKGDGNMQAAEQDCKAPPTRNFNTW